MISVLCPSFCLIGIGLVDALQDPDNGSALRASSALAKLLDIVVEIEATARSPLLHEVFPLLQYYEKHYRSDRLSSDSDAVYLGKFQGSEPTEVIMFRMIV